LHLKRWRREINRLGASLDALRAGRGRLDLAAAHPIYPAPGAIEGNDAVSARFRRGISPMPAEFADLAA
jgi:hypothetical protein